MPCKYMPLPRCLWEFTEGLQVFAKITREPGQMESFCCFLTLIRAANLYPSGLLAATLYLFYSYQILVLFSTFHTCTNTRLSLSL